MKVGLIDVKGCSERAGEARQGQKHHRSIHVQNPTKFKQRKEEERIETRFNGDNGAFAPVLTSNSEHSRFEARQWRPEWRMRSVSVALGFI